MSRRRLAISAVVLFAAAFSLGAASTDLVASILVEFDIRVGRDRLILDWFGPYMDDYHRGFFSGRLEAREQDREFLQRAFSTGSTATTVVIPPTD